MRIENNQLVYSAEQCKEYLAAVGDALYVIGGKWKLRILASLLGGSMRFNELKRMVEGISSRVLSAELKELEMNGFIKRTVLQGSPAAVEYELTEYAQTLREIMQALGNWGAMHRDKIKQEFHKEEQVGK
jgi:DNA-binding HxlR family transcriptional regulator